MKVKRFMATSVQEALRQVKRELGAEAVILETEHVGGGVVVTAAIDYEPERVAVDPLRAEARALTRVVDGVLRERSAEPGRRGEVPGRRPAAGVGSIGPLERALAAQGVAGELAASLLREVAGRLDGRGMVGAIASLWAPPGPDAAGVDLFVGPPGDGKTTTVVKLAAQARRAGHEVAIISTDTHRVGARAELDVYGRALSVPVAHATTPEELTRILDGLQRCDRILIDTAGVAPGEREAFAELAGLVEATRGRASRTLVASATQGAMAAARTWAAFAAFEPVRGIVTKQDASPGAPLLAEWWRARLPISHVTTGRRIPADVAVATPGRLAEAMLAA